MNAAEDPIRAAAEIAVALPARMRDLPVTRPVAPDEIRQVLAAEFPLDHPRPAAEVVRNLAALVERWNVHVTHPRTFGFFNPSVTPASVAGDLLAAAYNPQLAVWSHAPAANEIERHVLQTLARAIGYPAAEGGAHFTSGGAEANHTATLTALVDRFPGFSANGVAACGGPPRLYVGASAHDSFHKIAVACGLGRAAVHTVACTADGRMDADALRAGIAADRAAGARPFLAVATAGTTAFGAMDPLESLAAVCAQEKLWLHVDAAWGGAWALVPRMRRHLAGLDRADSLTWDAHKALQVPMGAGMFFARNAAPVREAFGVSTGYMPVNTPGALDPHQNTMQWSRRAIGMKVLASLATAGLPGTIAMLERMAELGDRLRALLRADGWTIAHESPLPIACFSRPELGTAEAPVRAAAAAVVARGRCFVAPARMPDGSWRLRVCITSHLATEDDLQILAAELRAAPILPAR